MAGFRTTSTWIRIALVAMIIAIILFVIGFATLAWMEFERYPGQYRGVDWDFWSYGLWKQRICGVRHHAGCYEAENARVWLYAIQAMECLGLIFLVIAFILLILYSCVNSMKRKNPLVGIIVTTFLAVLFIVIGIAIFIGKIQHGFDVSWSMGLAIAAAVVAFFSGIMSLVELCCSR